ncbi:hypothetical protein [Azohydromonas caseinilytica]|uniref:Uncharacterized protein n=1 Tax=Azohydromonas caseinilytica TaxID=2728836 RepID=A0A848F9K4_9BURK|nr:hypothetical protein [Azohydromonas caseinilytica]NML16837.1 hypothetical protein [Azohydromonas caseinilytica]
MERLHAAAVAGDTPAQALARVGEAPWIDSAHPDHAGALRLADFAPDPRAPQSFLVLPGDARRVLYWGLADDPGAPRVAIAGLAWHADGSAPRMFRAQVLSP